MRHRRSLLLLLAASVAVAALGCSDNSAPSNPRPPAATYALTSFQNPPNPALTPPTATGTLVLAATTYDVTINVQGQDPVTDQGTYAARRHAGRLRRRADSGGRAGAAGGDIIRTGLRR